MARVTSREEPPNTQDPTAAVSYLPLSSDSAAGNGAGGDQSIGSLVHDATQHISTLVRAEVELAKSELIGEAKKAVRGSVYFLIAVVVLLYSSFFFFFALAELLADIGLWRSASYGIVFALMLLFDGLCGFLGWRKVKKIKAPERTIGSVKETAAAFRRAPAEEAAAAEQGQPTFR
jgi:hypothetical protein